MRYILPITKAIIACQVLLRICGYDLFSRGWHQLLTVGAVGFVAMVVRGQPVYEHDDVWNQG